MKSSRPSSRSGSKNIRKNKLDFDEELSLVLAESRQKDNRTQEIYNLKGVCENQLLASRKKQTEAENKISQSNAKLETFMENNKICSEDLKELRYSLEINPGQWLNIDFRDLFDKKKNEAENNFYLFQQKYKDTEFGIKIVDILDIFRFSRSDVEDLLNKKIIQKETNQDNLENT